MKCWLQSSSLWDAPFPGCLPLMPVQCRWICSPWHAWAALWTLQSPRRLCKTTAGWRANASTELTPVQWRFAKCLTPWEAVTCFSFNSSLNLTGARFEFSILARQIKSPRTVRFQALFLLILHSSLCDIIPHQGNYWHCVGHIKFLINQCVAISLLLLLQPPLLPCYNRSSSGASSSFHSHLLISSDIFQGWFLYCFRDIFLASSFCLLLETEHTWRECQKCDIFADLFLPALLPPLPVFSLDINDPEHELICGNGVIQQTCNVHFNLQWNLFYQLRPMGLEFQCVREMQLLLNYRDWSTLFWAGKGGQLPLLSDEIWVFWSLYLLVHLVWFTFAPHLRHHNFAVINQPAVAAPMLRLQGVCFKYQ